MSNLTTPLPERLRPQAFDEFIGQLQLWAPDAALRRLVEKDAFQALIFWGPPGVGKTSLARLIGKAANCPIVELSAVHASVKDLRTVFEESKGHAALGGRPTLLFLDEVHRLSKSQQDVLLPALEQGTIRFIGATTENPSFEVNRAILSRCLTFRFEALTQPDIVRMLRQAMNRHDSGLPTVQVAEEVLGLISESASGDARQALNLLSAVCHAANEAGQVNVDDEVVAKLLGNVLRKYDKAGDQHHDTISAFIKSIRGSHPDAAVYYLARMLDAGEDPMFIARRLVIAASEDVGNANPTALLIAQAAMQSVHMVGMPEARIMLAQATTYLAASPKSNRSYNAINAALADVQGTGNLEIPLHLRNAPTTLMKKFGYGKNYAYAHDDLAGARSLTYLPEKLSHRRYYEPSEHGVERQLAENLKRLRPQAD